MQQVLDVLRAHRKVILAALSVVLIQVVDQDTADWIIAVVGTLLVGGVPNDEAAKDRIYHRRR
jgi:hypothetical protein